MPGFDGTGPMGAGPLTGGGRGSCGPYGRTYGFYGRGLRGGFGPGRGRGYGRGFGWRGAYPPGAGRYVPAYTPYYGAPYPYAAQPGEELHTLRDEADLIRADLDAINKRIQELESKPDTDL